MRDHKGMFGNMKEKLTEYVVAYREDMAMVLALVKFLAYNIYSGFYLIFLSLLPRIFKTPPRYYLLLFEKL